MLTEKTFQTGVTAINYAEGPPSGPPLVLLHGGGDRWQDFIPIIPSLAFRWQVLALDLRGHGRSGRVPGKYRPEHYVADVVAFFERNLTEPAILSGHSLGGWIALMAATELQERVQSLILGDPPLDLDRFLAMEGSEQRQSLWRTLRELAGSELSVPDMASVLAELPLPGQDPPARFGDLPGMDAAYLRGWAKSLSQVDPDVAMYHAEGRLDEYVANVDLDSSLRRISCPVLLLQADPSQGGLVSDSDVDYALSRLSDGLHVKLEGAGHDLGLSTWQVGPLLCAVSGFLESS